MDTRNKQKRLGPAPIASFEKSFEDPSPLTVASIAAQTEIAELRNNADGIDEEVTQVAEDSYRNGAVRRAIADGNGDDYHYYGQRKEEVSCKIKKVDPIKDKRGGTARRREDDNARFCLNGND